MFSQIVEPLGFTPKMHFAYFVCTTRTIRILAPRQHCQAEFLAIETEVEWQAAIESLPWEARVSILAPIIRQGEQTGEYRINWNNLAGELMRLCREKGEFDPSIGRGKGIWRDESGSIIFNTGSEKVVFDGGKVERYKLHKIAASASDDPFRYLSARPIASPPNQVIANIEDVNSFLDALSLFDWKRDDTDAILLLGWIACATIFNLLDFRPHIAITAERGAGKSTLVGRVVELLGADTNCLHIEADATTEPGLRQTLGYDAIPVIADEFETTGKHARDLLRLFRLASNPSVGRILKGSADGTPQEYTIRTSVIIAGITINFENAADATRFAVVELQKKSHSEAQRLKLKSEFEPFNKEFGTKLARFMIENFEVFQTNLTTFRSAILEQGGDDRQADLYGHLHAGCWTATRVNPATLEEAMNIVEWFEPSQDDDQDERDCLNHLLGHVVRNRNASVSEFIQIISEKVELPGDNVNQPSLDFIEAERILEQMGVKVKDDQLIVANKVPGINEIFSNTQWRRGGHAKRLKRMGGSSDENRSHRFHGIVSKVTSLDMDQVFPKGEL